jgi:hypothetical protein
MLTLPCPPTKVPKLNRTSDPSPKDIRPTALNCHMKASTGPEQLVLKAAAIIHQAVGSLPAADKIHDFESRLETIRCAVAMVAPFYSEDALHSWPSSVIVALRWSESIFMNGMNQLEQLAGLLFLAGDTLDAVEISEISGFDSRCQISKTPTTEEYCDILETRKYVKRAVNSCLAPETYCLLSRYYITNPAIVVYS